MSAPAVHPRFPRRSEFRAWLAGLAPAAVVGHAALGDRCPLASYVRVHGFPEGQVDSDAFLPHGTPHPFRSLPAWASVFVHDVDIAYQGLGGPITARGALALLDSIPAVAY